MLTDRNASVIERSTTAVAGTTVDAVVEAIAAAVDGMRAAVRSRRVYGVGVGLAGVIDRISGVVRRATYFDWHDVDLAELLAERTGLPAVVENDVNSLAVSETWFGAGRGMADVAVVSIGRGVGLGMVLDGRLYRGAAGGAGEFGHTKVSADGPACPCGGRGCLEALIGESAIRAHAAAVVGRPVAID